MISEQKNEKGYFEADTFEVSDDPEVKLQEARKQLASTAVQGGHGEIPFLMRPSYSEL